jgi:hypothetical protein
VALVAQRQRAVEEQVAGLGGQLDELGAGELLQRGAGGTDLAEVAADDAGVDVGDQGLDLAGLVVLGGRADAEQCSYLLRVRTISK